MEGAKCTSEHIPLFRSLRPQLANVCNLIDALEKLVDRVGVDLATLEADVEVAEADLGVPDKRFGMLNPFDFTFCTLFNVRFCLQKKQADVPSTTKNVGIYRPPVIFKTNDYFNNTKFEDNA